MDAHSPALPAANAEWPASLGASFAAMPQRCLFHNERVSVVLTGLSPGQNVILESSGTLLLLITFGQLRLTAAGQEMLARESDSAVLLPGTRYTLAANEAVDFLLLNFNPHSAWQHRCLCHGTDGRQRLTAAAAEILGFYARV